MLKVSASRAETANGRQLLHGSLDQWLDDLHRLTELGVGHVLVGLGATPVDEQLRTMTDLRAQCPQ